MKRAMLLATFALVVAGATYPDEPDGPPDIALTCQQERQIMSDGRVLSSFAEDPFAIEIWSKPGIVSWAEGRYVRATLGRTQITFQDALLKKDGWLFDYHATGRIDRLTGYYRFDGGRYPSEDPRMIDIGHCKLAQPKF